MDYHATTPVDPRVLDAMMPFFSDKFGNPASRQHQFGWISEEAVTSARGTIAKHIRAEPREIIFTSGATESNNLSIKGVVESSKQNGDHIITAATEHRSVLDTCKKLEKLGIRITYLGVDQFGQINLDKLSESITPKTILVSIMAANNEIGTIQNIADIGNICHTKGVFFHSDATQAVGKIPIDVTSMNIDLLSFSAHKMYGPKGVGVLYVRSANPKVKLTMQMDGGGHERGIRSGTLNVPGIVGLAKALEISILSIADETERIKRYRDKMYNAFITRIEKVQLNGHPIERLPNNLNISFLGVEDNALMMSLKDIALSIGSACSTADPEPSHVLKALHLPQERLHSAIRFGLGRFTTEEEVDYVINRVIETVDKLRSQSPSFSRSREIVQQQ
jgi:cysteine desulfurase